LRSQIVAQAREYARRHVRYVQPAPIIEWDRRNVEPSALDCSSLVARVCLVVLRGYYDRLGEPSAARWAGDLGSHGALPETSEPQPGDLVFYRRKGSRRDAEHGRPFLFHVGILVGSDLMIAACDHPSCGRVVEHPTNCPHRRWTMLEKPYRRFPLA
jgi:cell wall-associated NlpC family hydrolase